ncbi:Uncharacterised protein [Mycobacteroides abscessus subsp. abscessus]|nr:Uncharacterised protein [Mycobacteroides abscessus subsp. abscessus]
MRSSASSESCTRAEKTPRSVRFSASRRSSIVWCSHPVGSLNSAFSKYPSPRVNSVTPGEMTVTVETRCPNSSLSTEAAVSPPPITATRSAVSRMGPAQRRQNSAMDKTFGCSGSTERSG